METLIWSVYVAGVFVSVGAVGFVLGKDSSVDEDTLLGTIFAALFWPIVLPLAVLYGAAHLVFSAGRYFGGKLGR